MNNSTNDPSGQKKNNIIYIIRNFLRGKDSPEGKDLFDNWWQRPLSAAGEPDQGTGTWNEDEQQLMSIRVLRRLKKNISDGHREAGSGIGTQKRRITWQAAAAILLIIGTGGYLWRMVVRPAREDWQVVTTIRGEKRKLTLPDGTVITLNEKSQLQYPRNYTDRQTREIRLEGEAFFDVAKDPEHPFIVNIRHAEIKVLGTCFDVLTHQTDSSIVVAMQDGKVSLRDDRQDANATLFLAKGDIGILSREGQGLRESATADSDNYFSWMDNRGLGFEGTPLSQVIIQLKRIYGCRIVLDDPSLMQRKITLQYPNTDLATILRVIGKTMQSTVVYVNGEYHIR